MLQTDPGFVFPELGFVLSLSKLHLQILLIKREFSVRLSGALNFLGGQAVSAAVSQRRSSRLWWQSSCFSYLLIREAQLEAAVKDHVSPCLGGCDRNKRKATCDLWPLSSDQICTIEYSGSDVFLFASNTRVLTQGLIRA